MMMLLSNKLPEGSRPPPQTMDNWLLLGGSARSPQTHARIKVKIVIWCLRIVKKEMSTKSLTNLTLIIQ